MLLRLDRRGEALAFGGYAVPTPCASPLNAIPPPAAPPPPTYPLRGVP